MPVVSKAKVVVKRKTTSMAVPVSFSVADTSANQLVVWAKAVNQGKCSVPSNGSQHADAVVEALIDTQNGMATDTLLLTVLAWDAIKADCVPPNTNTVRCIGSVAVEVSASAPTTRKQKTKSCSFAVSKHCTATFHVPSHINLEDCSKAIVSDIELAAKHAAKDYCDWLKMTKFKFVSGARPYFQPTMVEADWVFRGNFISVPAIAGWPQLGRLKFNALCCWSNAVTHACTLLGVKLEQICTILETSRTKADDLNLDRVMTVLTVLAITAFAGAYPIMPETVDDRTLGAMKLGTNRDCDDMAITVCAVFNHLKDKFNSGHMPSFSDDPKGLLDRSVLLFMLGKYKTAAAIICRADPTVATADSEAKDHTVTGHVYAILSETEVDAGGNAEALIRGATVIEATRVSSPYPEALDSSAFFLNGTRVFTRSAYVLGEKDIQHVKPYMPEQYLQNIAAYTTDATYALVSGDVIGVSGPEMAAGSQKVKAVKVHATSKSKYVHNALAHSFDLADLDDAIAKYEWWRQLGFDSKPDAPCLHQDDWTHLVERNLAQTNRLKPFHVTTKYHQFVWAIIDPRTNALVFP